MNGCERYEGQQGEYVSKTCPIGAKKKGSRQKGCDKKEVPRTYDPNARLQLIEDDAPGRLGGIAAMMLMTLMYSTRVARFDLHKAVQILAKRITRWDA